MKYCSSSSNSATYHINKQNYQEFFNFDVISSGLPEIKDVIYHEPAVIVFWTDGTKTVVKANGEAFDPEKGLAMAYVKKILGNKGNYYNLFKKWLPDEEKEEEEKETELEKAFKRAKQIRKASMI